MSIFLIDYENVHTSAFAGLESLTGEDRVVVFYTNNSDSLTFSLMQRLMKAQAKIDYIRVASGGKNSLDFQLCSYLGFLMGTTSDARFCIVSRDKGFNTMLSFWNENIVNNNFVVCCPNIRLGLRVTPQETNEEELTDEALEIAPEKTEEEAVTEPPVEEVPAEEPVAEEKPADPEPEQSASEEQPAGKPKRKYTRRTPYKRKPKTAEEQTA